ncbi:LamG-like jellyroll fold domain-containing protein [Actinokineospora sp. HUAS TT18]|uniref:LamG-like jellyroll fold domain-containing protein n=1 Tax=Actinokineospora sp. HUAS TT18 TaxID=3447451 RepID=UPI003F522058
MSALFLARRKTGARSAVAVALSFGLAFATMVVPTTAQAAPTPVVADEAQTEAAASAAARTGKKSVRVLDKTDEITEVRANQDGSFTWTQHVRPVRVKQAGKWVTADTTLVRRADGSIGPKAAVVDLALSGGGKGSRGSLARVAANGVEAGLGWIEDLPEPVLDGSTATYREVLPGVDIKVTADVLGYSEVLVVKTPEAARNPKLKKITFGVHAKGGKLELDKGKGSAKRTDAPADKQTPGDGLRVAGGETALSGDASAMWDSSAESMPELRGTGLGARRSTMGVEVTDSTVTIEPDQAFLAAPTTKYPVYLDPDYNCTSCGKAHHIVVQSAWPTAKNFDRTDDDLNDLKAGYVCEGTCFTSRTYLRMKTLSLAGKKINSAYLHLDTIHSYYCSGATPTQLYLAEWFNENTDWNSKPNPVGAMLSSGNTTKNVNHCPGNPGGMDLWATSALESAAAGGWGETTFMVRGEQEGNNTSWRRFDLNPYLVVKYNSFPNPPSNLGMSGWGMNPDQAIQCGTGANRAYVSSLTPRLRATLSDPDGGSLDAAFRIYKGIVPNHVPWDGTEIYTGWIPSGQYAEVQVPAGKITGEGDYSWNLWSGDGQLTNWSGVCEMTVDKTPPDMPRVDSPLYPFATKAGGVGVSSTFTFRPPTQVELGAPLKNDIAYYLYSLPGQGDAPVHPAYPAAGLNGTVAVAWAPTTSGPHKIHVRSVDRAGNQSQTYTYEVEVSDYKVAVSGQAAKWSFEGDGKDTSDARTLLYTGMPMYGLGGGKAGHGQAMTLGAGDHAVSRMPLLQTDRALSMTAWVKLDAAPSGGPPETDAVVLSQDGYRRSGFKLYYDKTQNEWGFEVPHADTDAANADRVWVDSAVRFDPDIFDDPNDDPADDPEWTFLAAVYDPAANKARLHVDGVSREINLAGDAWQTFGSLVVGAGKTQALRTDTFGGSIDTVRLFDEALSEYDVNQLYTGSGMPHRVAEYKFEGPSLVQDIKAAMRDSSYMGALETALGPPLVSAGHTGSGGDVSKTGSVMISAPAVVSTTDSFTVGGWVKLNDTNGHYAVASQGGTNTSSFILRYAKDVNRWIFGVPSVDATADNYQWAVGTSAPKAGEWNHVLGVFDSSLKTVTLYVNGVKEAQAPVTTSIATTRQFELGDGRQLGGTLPMRLKGVIDELVVYKGAVTEDDVKTYVFNNSGEQARWALGETTGTSAANSVQGRAPATLFGPGVTWGEAGGKRAAVFDGVAVRHSGLVSGAGPLAAWSMNDTTVDYSGNGRDLQHWNNSGTAPANYVAAMAGKGVKLNGTDQRLVRQAPVVNTDASYSIAAWVKPDRTDISYTIAGQDGARTSPFLLEHIAGRWSFTMLGADTDTPSLVRTSSVLPPKAGAWTHLLGVYDKQAGKARLYVNGYLEAESAFTSSWASTGSFTVGRGKWAGAVAGYFPGTVDEVRAYDRALTAADAHGLWNLTSDITAPRGEAFRADKSFTVGAWVRAVDYTRDQYALSLGSVGRFSTFMVGYRADFRRWAVLTETSTGVDPVDTRWILSDNEADTYTLYPDGWVYLAVTYDSTRKTASLYVNGLWQSTVPDGGGTKKVDLSAGAPPPAANWAGRNLTLAEPQRDLVVGRATWQGLPIGSWKGAIRDVRVFTGLLPSSCDNVAACLGQPPA